MNQIKNLRNKLGLSQSELCSRCGWVKSPSSRISNYERGISTPPLEDCRRIVRAFVELGIQCTLDDVFPPSNEHYSEPSEPEPDA